MEEKQTPTIQEPSLSPQMTSNFSTSVGPKWPKILIPLVVLILLVVGYGVLAKNYGWWPHQVLQTPTPSLSDVDMSNWQTYENNQYKFSLRYPKGWLVNTGDQFVSLLSKQPDQSLDVDPTLTWLSINPGLTKDPKISFEAFVKSQIVKSQMEDQELVGVCCKIVARSWISGHAIFETGYLIIEAPGVSNAYFVEQDFDHYYLFTGGENNFDQSLLQSILSTLQFTTSSTQSGNEPGE